MSIDDIRDLSYLISEYKLKRKSQSDFIKDFPSYTSKLNRIAYYVNLHQTSIVTTKKDSQNMSLTKELQILSNPQNIASMEVSVDLSLDELKAFANEKGVQSEHGLSV
jgi:hypothetical protein